MITLHQFPAAHGLSSVSPFCTKVETFLRLTGLEHRVVDGDPRRAPKGKLPYIEDEDTVVADSGFIVEHCRIRHARDLDGALDDEQRALGHLARRTAEEHLYWALVYTRWIDEAGWPDQRRVLASILPAPLRAWLPALVRRRVHTSLRRQGLGRHSPAEIYALGVADIDALAAIVGAGPFLLGGEPTSYDATVHAFCWHARATPHDNPLTRAVKRHPNLLAYLNRVHERAGYAPIED